MLSVLGAILVLSLIGVTVLQSSTTRLNVASNHVRAWKEALSAAESGGDIAFAEIRRHKAGSDPATWWTGWIQSGTTYISPVTTFGSSNLKTRSVVETGYFDVAGNFQLGSNPTGNNWYRLRSKGTAPLPNLKRTGMDDTLINDGRKHFAAIGSTEMQDITARGNGDSLLRKIDFQYDHFVATYGPSGNGQNKQLIAATNAPSISRRIEQIVTPVTPFFDAAIKCAGDFRGLGDAAMLDSYDSRNGPYYFCANNPADPHYSDSRHGSLQIGNATATIRGMLYGDVATNGGNIVRSDQITGSIDNNVPFNLDPYAMPSTAAWVYVPPPLPMVPPQPWQLPSAVTGTSTLTPAVAGTPDTPAYYVISSLSGMLTVNPVGNAATYVAIKVTGGDITGKITVNGTADGTKGVHLKIYFDGNIRTKTTNIANQSPTVANPYAGNLEFYGISPTTPGATQTIDLNPGGSATYPLTSTFYAPSAVVNYNGNSDFIGTMVCKSFYSNGNISWHFDRALNDEGELLDFRIASYVEDTR